ncbi:F-box protein SKIP23-like [Papaver somniferum]|uniref:F-box protein SKIP23-like n=1 Tax=Papaver somniferum TaxID=3469 RepID=UPI000E6FD33B|nr:F-box protein SKIP23-like [Papaver somniferum]
MEVDWSKLPPYLVELVALKLTLDTDYIKFRSVCPKWRSLLSPSSPHLPPWLMLTFCADPQLPTRRQFYFNGGGGASKCDFQNRLKLPEEDCKWGRCVGSSNGLIVLLSGKNSDILLFNPITRTQVFLPKFKIFPKVSCIRKIVLSKEGGDCIALASISKRFELGYCKKGNKAWSVIKEARGYGYDIIYFKGLFYGVNIIGWLAICDVNGVSPVVTVIKPSISVLYWDKDDLFHKFYLVDSFGELLLVARYLSVVNDPKFKNSDVIKTSKFRVFRLDTSAASSSSSSSSYAKWVEVYDLGERMLFVGGGSSALCLAASEVSGCEGNCVYFVSEYNDSPWNPDTGVFNLANSKIQPLKFPNSEWRCTPTAVWVKPYPC